MFELPDGSGGLRLTCNCGGCGERLLTDRAATWDELEESLSDCSVLRTCPGRRLGELSGCGEYAPGRL